jgi:hypothetical protein
MSYNWTITQKNAAMTNLILPQKVIIQLVNMQGQPFEIPNVIFFVHLFARHKNDFHLGPFVSDQSGKVVINQQELIWYVQATYESGLMDYSAVETCHPFIEITFEHPDRIKRVLETREKIWKMLLKGEQEIWGRMENLLNAYRNASNEQLELLKDSSKISDVWDGTKNEYEYKFPISIKT